MSIREFLLFVFAPRIVVKKVKKRYQNRELFVAIDLETTGLNPRKDEIIEVGALKFSNKGEEWEYSELIKPSKPIPFEVFEKTGIAPEMVTQAPRFEEIKDKFIQFVNDCIILGWNLSFDLAFLRKKGVRFKNPTYECVMDCKATPPTPSL